MANGPLSEHQVQFTSPGVYRIEIQGHLEASWSDRLAGMQITVSETEDGTATTTLVGHLRDQTQLSGVLNSLHDLHLPILLVEHLKGRRPSGEDAFPKDTSSQSKGANGGENGGTR
jgi:hypothetical protein